MKSFSYRAYSAEGKRQKGQILADDAADASARLRRKGLFPEDISEQATRVASAGGLRRVKKLDPDLQAVFARQMAVLLSAGLPVDEALEIIRTAGTARAMEQVATRTRALVLEGMPLSGALVESASGFPAYVTSAIRAGEASRDLTTVFETVADHLETRRSDRATLATALIYPGFVAAVSILICGVLMTTVAPEMAAMFETTGRPLPRLTEIMLGLTDWISTNSLPLTLGSIAAILGIAFALRVPSVRNRWDGFLLGMPVIGRLLRLDAAHQYLRTLSLVISSRQPVVDGIESATDVLTIERFRQESVAAQSAIKAGSTLSAALKETSFVPPVAQQLVEAGEKSARIAQMTERAAVLLETWLGNDRKRIATLLDPALMMLVGVFVLVVVLSILLPIFDMQSSIGT